MRGLRLVAAGLLIGGCAAVPAERRPEATRPDPAEARKADDAALAADRASLGGIEGHYVAVAGGRTIGGTTLIEDTVGLLRAAAAGASHAYLFELGTEGDRAESVPAIYGPRLCGNALLAALGVEATVDPVDGTTRLGKGGQGRTFPFAGGSASATFTIEPASGLGAAREVSFVVSTGWSGTALVGAEDADALGLALSEVPGTVTLGEVVSGRSLPCRRALCRVSLERLNDNPLLRSSAVVEVLYPR